MDVHCGTIGLRPSLVCDSKPPTILHTLKLDAALGTTRTARVWFGDLPEAQYPAEAVLSRTVLSRVGTSPLAGKRVVVELVRPNCGPSTYALLGGSFAPNETQELKIEAAVAGSPGPSAPWAMPLYPNFTNVWLSRQFADAVIEAAAAEVPSLALGGGVLRFDRAVKDQVGSSQWMFKIVARLVMHLMVINNSHDDDQLAEIFRKLIHSTSIGTVGNYLESSQAEKPAP